MPEPKPEILLIEDNVTFSTVCKETLEDMEDGPLVHIAHTVQQARDIFAQRSDNLKIISVDGCLQRPGDTIPLVEFIIENGFAGLLIAASADRESNSALMNAGCRHTWPKEELVRLLGVYFSPKQKARQKH